MLQEAGISIPQYPREKWMSSIPDHIHLNNLKIPGTHNSGTGSNPYKFNVSKFANFAAQCNDLDIPTQFRKGIRYIDIRLKLETNGDLYVYHKVVKYNVTFSDILNEISIFFDENPRECIIIRLHREDGDPGGMFHRKSVSDKEFVDSIVKNLKEFSDREREKRLLEREQMQSASNNNNNDEYLNAIYNEEDDNPVLGKIRRKIILFGIIHVADVGLLECSPFKFRKIYKQAVYKLKCNEKDINEKMRYIKEGFLKSKSEDFQNVLFVNEVSAVGSFRVLSFIPDPRKMAEIMNNIMEPILIQLIKDKARRINSSSNAIEDSNNNHTENNNNNEEEDHSNTNQNINESCENDFQGVLMFDFPDISKEGQLIELVYSLNAFL